MYLFLEGVKGILVRVAAGIRSVYTRFWDPITYLFHRHQCLSPRSKVTRALHSAPTSIYCQG